MKTLTVLLHFHVDDDNAGVNLKIFWLHQFHQTKYLSIKVKICSDYRFYRVPFIHLDNKTPYPLSYVRFRCMIGVL